MTEEDSQLNSSYEFLKINLSDNFKVKNINKRVLIENFEKD
jgi:hypothetical protein